MAHFLKGKSAFSEDIEECFFNVHKYISLQILKHSPLFKLFVILHLKLPVY